MKTSFAAWLAFAFSLSLLGGSWQQGAPSAAPSTTPSTNDVLNFALNLEYLEAEFYSCAATGQPLSADLRGGGPPSTGCQKAKLGPDAQAIAEEIAQDETAHVRYLRQVLGDQAVPIPQLNIGSAFTDAANAALHSDGSTPAAGPPFSPYANDLFFYHGAFIFEDVGVTGYAGAIPLFANTPYLQPAAQIEAVEAYHAGIIRSQLWNVRNQTTPYNIPVANLVRAISDLRDSADGASDDDSGIEATDGSATLVPVNENALVFTRTPSQVLNIVTLGGGPSGGGFFPKGLNGAFGPPSPPSAGR